MRPDFARLYEFGPYLERFAVRAGSGAHVERRFAGDLEIRQDDDTGIYKVRGYALRWDTRADLGWFTESFQRGAFSGDGVLDDVRFKVGHDYRRLALARSPKTATFREDDTGLYYEADLDMQNPDTIALASAVGRGDVDGCSIGFTMRGGKYEFEIPSDDNTLEKEHVTIVRVGNLFENSAVDFPAYASSSLEPRATVPAPPDITHDVSVADARIRLLSL